MLFTECMSSRLATKDRNGKPIMKPEDEDEYQELNTTQRIVSDRLSGEAASLLFNDGYLNGGNQCGGVCVHPATCTRLGGAVKGICSRNGGVCCMCKLTSVSEKSPKKYIVPDRLYSSSGLMTHYNVLFIQPSCSHYVNNLAHKFPKIVDRTCNQVSKEMVSFFHSPGYPAPVIGTLICQHDVIVLPGVCGIR